MLAEPVPRFEVFAPTLHGHDGGPTPPEGPAHSLSSAADHLESLLDDQGITTAHFGGNSLGGALRDMLSRGHLMPGVEALRMAKSSLGCSVVDDVYTTMRDRSARAVELDRVSCPVLVAWGERDRVLPPYRHARHFGEGIPGVGLRLLPGIGHVPMWDDPALSPGRSATSPRRRPCAATVTRAPWRAPSPPWADPLRPRGASYPLGQDDERDLRCPPKCTRPTSNGARS